MPTLQFLGATGTVTGSKYVLEAGGERLMIDCGLFQGLKELRDRNWSPLPVPPSSIPWLVLTHAHLDHTGYIPRLIKDGFRGQIFATGATIDLSHLILPDSGHIQEEDAAYANQRGYSSHAPALPLYTHDDAVRALESFRPVDESKPFELSPHYSLRFFRAGHILGARMIEVTVKENGFSRRILFSGDIGRPHQLIIREPAVPDSPDLMLCESTYGDRLHSPDDHHARLASVVRETVARGGQIVIPSFAVGRSQELLYIFRELIAQNAMPALPIYLDSPMAIDATDLYRRHREDHNLETDDLEKHGTRLFAQPNVHFERSVADSKALNDFHDPCIIISASGMVTGGRILHHLARCLPDSRNTVIFVGYQGAGTRGQTIQSGAKSVKMLGDTIPIQAHIETMEHLSGHADYGEILALLGKFEKPPSLTYLVHGEPQAAESLRQKISQQLKWNVTVPKYLDKVPL